MTHPIEFSHISKRYQLGLKYYSLRDAIPAVVKRWWKRTGAPLQDGTLWALSDVSFHVAQGETLGIIGRNGAGKSTILKLISQITRPTSGTISVRGKLAALIEVGAGFHPDLTGRENIFLNGTILGLKRQEIRALFDRIVAFAELEPFIDTPVKRYSSGMYVRLGFAVAAHIHPEVLLIDEVLAVGDFAFQQKCLQRIQELKQSGTTILFISHNLNAVQRICDRVLLLDSGHILTEGQPREVVRAYREHVAAKERQRAAQAIARSDDGVTGPGVVQIKAVQLRNDAHEVAETFKTGERVTVEVRYVCRRRIEHPTVKISLERVDGLMCHVASLQDNGAAVPPLEGKGVLRLTYRKMNLLPNDYRVSVEVGEEGQVAPLERRQFGCFFTVTSDQDAAGTVHLDHYWHLGVKKDTPPAAGDAAGASVNP